MIQPSHGMNLTLESNFSRRRRRDRRTENFCGDGGIRDAIVHTPYFSHSTHADPI
jgi:hypothetical protein